MSCDMKHTCPCVKTFFHTCLRNASTQTSETEVVKPSVDVPIPRPLHRERPICRDSSTQLSESELCTDEELMEVVRQHIRPRRIFSSETSARARPREWSAEITEDDVRTLTQRVSAITRDEAYASHLAMMISELGLDDSSARMIFDTVNIESISRNADYLMVLNEIVKYKGNPRYGTRRSK